MFKNQALEYAQKYKWHVFPCKNKIPLLENGFKGASNDIAIVEKMFSDFPNANIAVVTGKISNLFILDIDSKNGSKGEESLSELEKEFGKLPETVESITWSGGRHLFFNSPKDEAGCRTGIRPGIDIRASSGYIIVPPSVIKNKSYTWKFSPDNIPIADIPKWLLDITTNKEIIDISTKTVKIRAGKRNSTLISIAGSMRRAGCEVDLIEGHLLQINEQRCDPPLKQKEVIQIANSSARYPAKIEPAGPTFNCNTIADTILKEKALAFCLDINYEWNGTTYIEKDISYIRKLVQEKLSQAATTFKVMEVIGSMKRKACLDAEQLNWSPLLNLKNGMFNIDSFAVIPHDSKYYSTIQLPVEYIPNTDCPTWIQTLDGIFGDKPEDEKKQCIEILQEFFGLCLTKEVKYEKSLFLLGEGRNGKSTIIYALENILGHANYSAVTLEALVKPNYISELFGKLANISIETNAKSSIYDAMFKAIISGDTIAADRKYGHPFKFRPFCKMVFALNNMPQVNDKTDAYFKRLLIIRLTRQFSDIEQDRELKQKLVKEVNGIFLWILQGYHRLRSRGYFAPGAQVDAETEEYRKENNSVLTFVEEECKLDATMVISKDALYKTYKDWCKDSGLGAFSKKKFGIQLIKHYSLGKEARGTQGERIWEGITLNKEVAPYGSIY